METITKGNYTANIRSMGEAGWSVAIVYANEWMQQNGWAGEVMEAKTYKTEKTARRGAERMLANY